MAGWHDSCCYFIRGGSNTHMRLLCGHELGQKILKYTHVGTDPYWGQALHAEGQTPHAGPGDRLPHRGTDPLPGDRPYAGDRPLTSGDRPHMRLLCEYELGQKILKYTHMGLIPRPLMLFQNSTGIAGGNNPGALRGASAGRGRTLRVRPGVSGCTLRVRGGVVYGAAVFAGA
jgi:hypothetical protein